MPHLKQKLMLWPQQEAGVAEGQGHHFLPCLTAHGRQGWQMLSPMSFHCVLNPR